MNELRIRDIEPNLNEAVEGFEENTRTCFFDYQFSE